ncbi:MAG: hypothetical protein CM15mV15_1160 [uncultured marine virus]|nr:MAG: hypothetical protein CM15mV15_1160 [uncultured marine virus]
MILVDMNQVMIANLMVSLSQTEKLQEGLVRHMVLNSLLNYRSEFKKSMENLFSVMTTDITGDVMSSLTIRVHVNVTEKSLNITGIISLNSLTNLRQSS